MKSKHGFKKSFKLALIVSLCTMIFCLSAYGYLKYKLQSNNNTADAKDYTVPYEYKPESKGILLTLPDSSALLLYFDFKSGSSYAVNIESPSLESTELYGYPVDFKMEADYDLIAGIIDRVGGIELTVDNETYRWTGIQIKQLLAQSRTKISKKEIINTIFEAISKNGFTKSDFVYIIDNSNTNLTVPDCFYWDTQMREICSRLIFVNWE